MSMAILASLIGSVIAFSPAEARHRHYFGNYNNQNFFNGTNSIIPGANPLTGMPFNTNHFRHHRHHHNFFNGYNNNNSWLNNNCNNPYNRGMYNNGLNNWNGQGTAPWLGNVPTNGWPTNVGNGFLGNGNVPRGNAWGYWRQRMQQGNRGWW
jgi:hypothetical protein